MGVSSSRGMSSMRTLQRRKIEVAPHASRSEEWPSEALIRRRLRSRHKTRTSSWIPVGLAIAGLSALYLFVNSLGGARALWQAVSQSQKQASELAETRDALALAHRALETLNRDHARVVTDLARVREEKAVEQDAVVREREQAERLGR